VAAVVWSKSLKGTFLQKYKLCFNWKINDEISGFNHTILRKCGEFGEAFQKMFTEPMKGVMIEASWSLYGYWDFVIFFKADSNKNSLHFVGKVLRAISGIADTRTSPMNILEEHKQ
jgi:hypothetical protein